MTDRLDESTARPQKGVALVLRARSEPCRPLLLLRRKVSERSKSLIPEDQPERALCWRRLATNERAPLCNEAIRDHPLV